MAKSRFAGADVADVMTSVPKLYEYPGAHRLEILRVTQGDTPSDGIPYFGAELRVLSSTNPSLREGQTVRWATTNRGGFSTKYFLSSCKEFVGAAAKSDPNQVGESEIDASTDDDQPLAAATICAEVMTKTTTNPKTGVEKTNNRTTWFSDL